jgi:methylamine dehydrogenase accessory protein MauD
MSALAISNVVLWIVVLALLALVLALTRQIGVLHERISPVGALMINKGLKVGEQVPVVDVSDLNGQVLKVGAPRSDGLSMLLLFVSPTCPVCESLLPVLQSSRKQEKSWLQIVLASDGELAAQREFVRGHGLTEFQYVVSAPLGMTYQVSRLPFAALVDAGGVLRARGLVNSREHLESLFEAQRLGVASLQDYFVAHS